MPDRSLWQIRWVRALLRRHGQGVTVVIVNWNGAELLQATVGAVRRFSPGAQLLVVDNASTDTSREWLDANSVRTIRNRRNIGHGPALDQGFHASDTEFTVALDSDAFPISNRWLDVLFDALDGNVVAGADTYGREFAHPCCLIMRTEDFVRRRLSFRVKDGQRGPFRDVGEAISVRLSGRVGLIPLTDDSVGSVYGGSVYHNWNTSRAKTGEDLVYVEREEVPRQWERAVEQYLDAST